MMPCSLDFDEKPSDTFSVLAEICEAKPLNNIIENGCLFSQAPNL